MILLDAIPEKQPALMSLIYMGGLALLALLLGVSLLRRARRRQTALSAVAPDDLPREVRKRLGATSTNRGLHVLRVLFVLLALGVFGFHVYWARYAEERNERFQQLSYKDLRNRRLTESTLRGWILDRTGTLDRALAFYKRAPNGQIVREYSLDEPIAQIFGTELGDAGLERALFGIRSGAAPEAVDVVMERDIKQPANLDVRLTLDSELQKAAAEQLRDRHGAIVAINPQTGEVLAMYSNPTYSFEEGQDESTRIRLETNKRDNKLLNRALRGFYTPGSTFKTVVMVAAFLSNMQSEQFTCSGGGYYAQPGARVIMDDGGPGEVHGRIGIDKALEVSCNQYFAQLAVKLGPERLRSAAKLLGIGAYDTPSEAGRGRRQTEIWNTSNSAIASALAPAESAIVAPAKFTAVYRPYDLALEGFGQGYAGQMTPFQMALVASAIGNTEGRLMKTKIEYDLPSAVYAQVMSPQQAAEMRRIMGLITGGESGTARGVFAPVHAAGIITGGKTGTAEKVVPEFDQNGVPKTRIVPEYDRNKQLIGQRVVQVNADEHRIDSWFICIAPLQNPQIAIAVIVEGGGYGSKTSAPIAAALVMKARELGLLGLPPAPNAPAGQQPNAPAQPGQQPASPKPKPTPPGQRRPRNPPPQQTAQR